MRAQNPLRDSLWGTVLVASLAAFGSGCLKPAGAAQPHAGKVLFESCVNCHGQNGEGMANVAAPSIAGLPQWYVEAQLWKFRAGHRAYHPSDAAGLRMRPMSRQLDNELEIKNVSAYVASLPRPNPAPTLTGGDAQVGQGLYGTCLACHGPEGKGNEALKAPPLVGQNDWYLLAQLQKFKAGHRGTAKGDDSGASMRPMSMTLVDDQAIKNVLAYVATLSK